MENKTSKVPHVLALPYPSQGHVNPMLHFCKRLASKGLKATLATTIFISNTFNPQSTASVQLDTISDGYDDGGFTHAKSIDDYLARLQVSGSKTLAELITRHNNSTYPIDCIVYDGFLPWALDVAHQLGIKGAAFFTQACTVNYVYYCVHHRQLTLPVTTFPVSIDGLELLLDQLHDMPSFIGVEGSYPAYFEMLLSQFSNAHKADFVLVNTVYELEEQVVDSMSKVCSLLTIGPTIPSIYLDNRIEDDKDYGIDLFTSNDSSTFLTNNWLKNKPVGSVVYMSFGSMACLSGKQMEELAYGLKATNFYFIWAIRYSEEAKLPDKFAQETRDKGLIVNWSSQVEILSHPSVGCFFTHCGWNSTIEALSLGVPMVGMPQWTDQPTDAKLIEHLWKVGVRVKVGEDGIVGRKEIEHCIRQVLEGDRGTEIRKNAKKWRNLALQAISDGGSSDKNIREFVSKLKMKNVN
ncbi:UDP-glycosyltransferase 74F2 [Morus notabilis]|uniref:UDP-glycosyltransferase 74F2 n=1 Tax=Morus notabilis TaxID=981085 RepID=UPI000CECFD67|nr:UDP-glycosyltransferase 74F2 [Morus notabilis]